MRWLAVIILRKRANCSSEVSRMHPIILPRLRVEGFSTPLVIELSSLTDPIP